MKTIDARISSSGAAPALLLMPMLLMLAGCGPNLVKGESPFVSVSSMNVRDGTLAATYSIRNINDVPMAIDTLALTLSSGGTVLVEHTGRPGLEVDPNTTEDVTVEKAMDSRARELLESLERGGTDSLPFFLEGRVNTAEEGNLPFRHQGYLFRVPGRPGQFRATSTLAPEDR